MVKAPGAGNLRFLAGHALAALHRTADAADCFRLAIRLGVDTAAVHAARC